MSSLRSYDLVYFKLDENLNIQILKYLECYFTASNPGAVVLAVFGVILILKQNTYKKLVLLVFFISLIILGMKEYVSDRFMMRMVMILLYCPLQNMGQELV